MKRIILLALIVVAGTMIVWSQVPQAMNYKAVAKDDWGVALPNKTITLRFTILQGSETGSMVYQETHTTVTTKFGLMDVEIGKGAPVISSFDMIDWSTGVYYIKIEMDPNGGTNFRLEDPPHQLLSVPYALYSESSGNSFSGYYNDLIGAPFLATIATTGNYYDLLNIPDFSSIDYNDLINKPQLFSGEYNDLLDKPVLFDGNWSSLEGMPVFADLAFSGNWEDLINTPVTLAGYDIKDAMSILHPAYDITENRIDNWNTAFNWGNHADASYLKVENDGSVTNEIQDLILTEGILKITNNPLASDIDLRVYKTDGSETKIVAGSNVTLGGEGTEANPYIINSTGGAISITLEQVLENGTDAGGKSIKNIADPVDNGDAVPKAYVDELIETISFLKDYILRQNEGKPMDISGNLYESVKIGNQYWLSTNLKTTKYANGDEIPDGTGMAIIGRGDLYWFVGDSVYVLDYESHEYTVYDYASYYGRMYTSFVIADPRGICPLGWRVPDSQDWEELIEYAGGSSVAGLALVGTRYDDIGFRAKLAGWYDFNHIVGLDEQTGFYSKASAFDPTHPEVCTLRLHDPDIEVTIDLTTSNKAFFVRCIRD